jgi:large subunit ribosomal protein L29
MAEKKRDLREFTEDELRASYKTYKEELFNLRFQLATGQLENTARLRTVRRNIARVMTYLQQAELEKSRPTGWLPPHKRRRRTRPQAVRRAVVAKTKAPKA